MSGKYGILISFALIIILGFAVYGNSLNGEFIYDDLIVIRDNVFVKSWIYAPKLFTREIGAGTSARFNYYRPFAMLTILADYSFWRLNVQGYHFTNIVIHTLTALSLYWFVALLYGDRLLSLLASILFLVHPIHSEVVSWISCRADSMATLFVLLCFIFYIKQLISGRAYFSAMSLSCYILAILSKESALILPGLLLLYHYAFKKKIKTAVFLPMLGVAFIYFFLRLSVFKFSLPANLNFAGLFQRFPGFFAAVTDYIRILIMPFGLRVEYEGGPFRFSDPRVAFGAITALLILSFAFTNRKRNSLVFFATGWFFVSLLPVSNIFYPLPFYMAERWLYLPSVGFFLILAGLLSFLYRKKKMRNVIFIFIIALIVFYSGLTMQQNKYWQGLKKFYKRTLKYAPNSARAYNGLGNIYYDAGKNDKAMEFYKKAVEADPYNARAYNNLGNVYYYTGRKGKAIELYKKSIEADSLYADAYFNLGNAYRDIGERQKAINSYKKTIVINSMHSEAYNNLGIIYASIGKQEEALNVFKKSITINPDCADVYHNLGRLYNKLGRKKEAVIMFKKAMSLKEHNP